jgi:hypothetical protein
MSALVLTQMVHAANIFMTDLASELQFIAEPFDRPPIRRNLRLDEFEGDFLIELLVKDSIDASHAPLAQLSDNLVPPGEQCSPGESFGSGFQRHGFGAMRTLRRR